VACRNGIKAFILIPKILSKLDLRTDAEYVAKLVNVSAVVNVQQCSYYTGMQHFLTDIVGCDWLKFSEIYAPKEIQELIRR